MELLQDIYIIWLYIIGTCLGSFLFCAVFRSYSGEEFVWTPSHCETCGTRLKALDLIPVFSWIYLRGRCRYCNTKIPVHSTVVEILTGLTLGILGKYIIFYDFALLSWMRCVLIILICVSAVTDIVNGEVPYTLQICMGITSIIAVISPRNPRTNLPSFSEVDPLIYLNAVVAVVVYCIALAVSYICSKYIGQGDVMIFTSIGLSFSIWSAMITMILSCSLALAMYLIRGRRSTLVRANIEDMLPGEGIRLVPFIWVTILFVCIIQPRIDYTFIL